MASPTPPSDRPDPDSIAERLKRQFGDQLGPTPPLDPEPAPDKDAPSSLFDKLRGAGTRGSRYRLLGEVARGGMGVVLKIWDDELRRTLAMKVVLGRGDESKGDTPHVDPKSLGRFLEEAQVTGQLDHPGIVPVHELGLGADGRVYFTMRLVKGEDLRTIFEKVRTGEDGWNQVRALGVLLKVCEAMSYAHSKKVVHRDLKPANVMVGKFGEVYVMDWGLARVLGREDKHDLRIQSQPTTQSVVKTERREKREETPDSPLVTMDGDVVGTPSFMPPEQAKGQLDKLGPHSDVYALGAMLYQLLTGQMPYVPHDARMSQRTILLRLIEGPPTSVESLAPATPPELVAISEKAMAREIGERYPTMQALAEDLRAYIEGRVVHAYEGGTWAEARKWVKRNKPLAASLAAAVMAVVVGGVVVALKNTELESKNSALGRAKSEAELKANDVLSLSTQKDLEDIVLRAGKLWPAYPDRISKYEAWLTDARELIDGRPADPAKRLKKRPSLEELKAKLAELRTKATRVTTEQAQVERESQPMYKALQAKQSELTWHSRMLGIEPWQSEADVEAQLAIEVLPSDANSLNAVAWPLVEPDRLVYGSEVKALLLARRAVIAATEAERGGIRDSLAWAYFRLGRFDEALSEAHRAVEESSGSALEASAARLKMAVASWHGESLTDRRAEHDALEFDVEGLVILTGERSFADPEDAWWHVQLSKLVSDLEALCDSKHGILGDTLAEPFGWGVRRRYEFARQIGERSIEGSEAKRLWTAAIAAIRSSPKYGGLELTSQLGLLPIGMDPDSGLFEFAHLQTGYPAVRGVDGKLLVTEEMGLVFVLLPGGRFWMGAQAADEIVQNYDRQALPNESPVHEVELSAYFLSKYEMTQGQWLRMAGHNPSYYGPATEDNGHQHDLTHPVEQVTWTGSMEMMDRLGLVLPSEAQWEFGCRAGTDTAWWTGADRESLRGKINLADQTAMRLGAVWPDIMDWPDLEDGWVVHEPVGSRAANPFGLHEVHGNVWEWCRDGYGNYSASNPSDPMRPWSDVSDRVYRGGSFGHSASNARSANRGSSVPEWRIGSLGLRPARGIAP